MNERDIKLYLKDILNKFSFWQKNKIPRRKKLLGTIKRYMNDVLCHPERM